MVAIGKVRGVTPCSQVDTFLLLHTTVSLSNNSLIFTYNSLFYVPLLIFLKFLPPVFITFTQFRSEYNILHNILIPHLKWVTTISSDASIFLISTQMSFVLYLLRSMLVSCLVSHVFPARVHQTYRASFHCIVSLS